MDPLDDDGWAVLDAYDPTDPTALFDCAVMLAHTDPRGEAVALEWRVIDALHWLTAPPDPTQ